MSQFFLHTLHSHTVSHHNQFCTHFDKGGGGGSSGGGSSSSGSSSSSSSSEL
jgi:hypothetical protein